MKLAVVICLNIIYSTISKSNFNNENRIGTYKMTKRFEENKAIYFTRDESDYLRNLVEKDMKAKDFCVDANKAYDEKDYPYEGCRTLKHYVWNVLTTGSNE